SVACVRVGVTVYVAFFFQAEDGIRGATVTGVQTCALPICRVLVDELLGEGLELAVVDEVDDPHGDDLHRQDVGEADAQGGRRLRSEERRVGKEGRVRGVGSTPSNIITRAMLISTYALLRRN